MNDENEGTLLYPLDSCTIEAMHFPSFFSDFLVRLTSGEKGVNQTGKWLVSPISISDKSKQLHLGPWQIRKRQIDGSSTAPGYVFPRIIMTATKFIGNSFPERLFAPLLSAHLHAQCIRRPLP